MGIFTWFLCPEEIQSSLPNMCHSTLNENMKVISYQKKKRNSIDSEQERVYRQKSHPGVWLSGTKFRFPKSKSLAPFNCLLRPKVSKIHTIFNQILPTNFFFCPPFHSSTNGTTSCWEGNTGVILFPFPPYILSHGRPQILCLKNLPYHLPPPVPLPSFGPQASPSWLTALPNALSNTHVPRWITLTIAREVLLKENLMLLFSIKSFNGSLSLMGIKSKFLRMAWRTLHHLTSASLFSLIFC